MHVKMKRVNEKNKRIVLIVLWLRLNLNYWLLSKAPEVIVEDCLEQLHLVRILPPTTKG